MSESNRSGGASNLSGVVYQMLWCLLRLMRIRVSEISSSNAVEAILILEPTEGGGDVRVVGETIQVEQLKSKSDGGTWSLQTIITEVFPDLFLATVNSTSRWQFRFITEGRMGRWDNVYKFFCRLRGKDIPTDILGELDDSRKLPFQTKRRWGAYTSEPPFFPEAKYTERSLFLLIAKHLKSCPTVEKQKLKDSELHHRLWQLLSAFHFDGEQTLEAVVNEIDRLLLAVVDRSDDLSLIRHALAQDLLTRASAGNAEITAEELLSARDLNATPLTNWSKIRSRSQEELNNLLAHRLYDKNLDVRADWVRAIADDWCKSPRVLVFAGESGQGKTWATAACSLHAAKDDAPVVWVDATGNKSEDLSLAADRFWLDIRGGESSIPMRQIVTRLSEVVPSSANLKLRICFDGVSDYNEASGIVRDDWPSKGVSIAISCSSQIAESLAEAFRDKVDVIPCRDFSWEELHDFLNRKLGSEWTAIPDDVRAVLKRPLLASIYCNELYDELWQPTNEYELFAAIWKRLSTRNQIGTPLDAALVEKLSGSVLLGQSYPWTLSQMLEHGINDAALNRLEACGWLTRRADERVEISHDRLLNWGVAQSLYSALRSQSRTFEDVVIQVMEINRTGARTGTPNLGYVPMDFLWLVAGDEELRESVGPRLLAALEPTYRNDASELYNLVRTLGERIAEIIFKRYCEFEGPPWILSAIGSALVATAGTKLGRFVELLLVDESLVKQRRGIQLLATKGCPDLLDRIWAFHVNGLTNPTDYLEGDDRDWILRDESWTALRNSAILCPQWITDQIRKADPVQEPVHDLAWLVANLKDGSECWQTSRNLLFKKIAIERPRVLAKLVGLFRDKESVSWLKEVLPYRTDMCSPVAIQSLSRIDAESAIAELSRVDLEQLTMSAAWAFGEIWHRMPQATDAKLAEMAQTHRDPFEVAFLYRERAHLIPIKLFQLLLNDLETKLKRFLTNDIKHPKSTIYRELSLLAECRSAEQLMILESKHGSTLENELRDFLKGVGPQFGLCRNSLEREPALSLLRRMNGDAFAEVLNDYMERGDRYGKHDAIQWAVKNPNAGTFKITTRLVTEEDLWEGFPLIQNDAMKLLAIHGHWEPVSQGLIKWGLKTRIDITGERTVPEAYSAPWLESVRSEVVQNPLPGNVLALAFAGSSADIPRLHEILEANDPDSELAHACIIGLDMLGDESERGVGLVSAHLKQKKHRHSATLMLGRAGTSCAWQALWFDLQETFDHITALNLLNLSDHAEEVFVLVKEQLPNQSQFGSWDFLRILIRRLKPEFRDRLLLDQWLREKFHYEATAREGNGWLTGTKSGAIECLSEFDKNAAFTVARQALETPEWHDRERYPYLLLEIDADQAIPMLLDRLVVEKAEPIRYAIGRALSSQQLQRVLDSRLTSHDANVRAAACFAISWAGDHRDCVGKLRCCLDDANEKVVNAAVEALDRLAVREVCEKLLQQASSEASNFIRRWLYVDAVIDVFDPGDTFRPFPKELQDICATLPLLARKSIEERLERQRKKVFDNLKGKTSKNKG